MAEQEHIQEFSELDRAESESREDLFGQSDASVELREEAFSVDSETALDRETELFNRFLDGSDEAYRALYDAFERPLYLYCCKLLGNATIAQDIFQDVWIRMYKLRGERVAVRRFSGLIYTIARNLSLNAIRDSKQGFYVSLEEMPPESEVFLRSQESEDADLREMMQKALAQLPFNQREAFILREYSGSSYQEIAEITGASMINVKTRAWRAKERLRKVIGAWLDLRATE